MSMEALRWARAVRGVTSTQKLVLWALADQANDDGLCWPSVAGIAADGGVSERTAQRALAALDAAGLVIRTGNGGRNMTRRYTLQFHVIAPVERVTSVTERVTSVTPLEVKRVTPVTERVTPMTQKGDTHDGKGDTGVTRTLKNPHLTLIEPTRASKPRATASVSSGFNEFWKYYPAKVGKQAALKAWPRALKAVGGDPDQIVFALKVRLHLFNPDFTPNPATWLNQGRWEDDIDVLFARSERRN